MSDVQTTGCTIAAPDSTGPTAGLLNMSGYCFNTSAPPNPNCKPGGQPCQAQAACNVTNSYCCLPTPKGADPKFPLISYCSPQYDQTDYAGSIPDVVPNNWGRGGSRGWPGAPTWSSAYGKCIFDSRDDDHRAFCPPKAVDQTLLLWQSSSLVSSFSTPPTWPWLRSTTRASPRTSTS